MLLLGSVLAVGLAVVFWLPTRFPPPVAWSDSYIFEFNNRLCEALFLVLALIFWLVGKARRLQWPASPLRDRLLAEEMPPRLLLACLLLASLLCALETWLTYRVGGIGDGAYFLDRIHLIERGQVPYRDFEFVYGSFSLYASIFLGKLFGCGSTAGFYMLWVAETLAGVALLWFGVRRLDLPAGGKRTVFFLLYCFGMQMVLAVTLNYTLLRYSLPFFAVALLPHLDLDKSARSRLQVAAAALAAVVLMLGISPEEGIALAVATVLYLPLRRLPLRRPWLPDTVLLAAVLGAVVRFSAQRGLFGTMGKFGAGAFNLPIYPGLPILLFFGAFFLLLLYQSTGRLAERLPSNLALLTIYSFGMLPGALGRCDAVHLAGYEMPLLAAALLLARVRPALWRAGTLGFAGIYISLWTVLMWPLGQPIAGKALLNHLYAHGTPTSRLGAWADRYVTRKAARDYGSEAATQKMAALRMAAEGRHMEPRETFPDASPVVMVPFGYMPNKLSNYQSRSVDEGYYMALSNITVPAQIEQKIAELRGHPERDLVVSEDGFHSCAVLSDSAFAMRHLLQYPFVPEPRHSVDTFAPVCTYIRANYHWLHEPANATFGYGVMRHNEGGHDEDRRQ